MPGIAPCQGIMEEDVPPMPELQKLIGSVMPIMLPKLPPDMGNDPRPSIGEDPPIIDVAKSQAPSPNIEFHIFPMTSMARIIAAMSPGPIVGEGRTVAGRLIASARTSIVIRLHRTSRRNVEGWLLIAFGDLGDMATLVRRR
ncbi:MAG: hypothetical protein U9R74_06125 [Pseudomonadota bacterium]|nr:hypothetical protein [Pseudomonadota bacterium]